MFVRAVHIDQFLAKRGQHLERGGGTVDELAVGPGGGENALKNQLVVRARFQSVFLKKGGRHRAALVQIEDGFDRATIATGTQESAIGPLAQQQIERADDDGFARARLPGNDIETGLQLQGQIGDQRQILDAQRA